MSVETEKYAWAQHPAGSAILRLWFTILFLIVMLIANLLAGSLGHDLPTHILTSWGIGQDVLLSGEVFRIITGTFLSHDPNMFFRQFIFAAAVIGYTEWTRGAALTVVLFFGLDIIGTIILFALIGLGDEEVHLTSTIDVGMSIGGFGLIGMAIARWRGKWLFLGTILLAIGGKYCFEPDVLADRGHVLALCLGFALGEILLHAIRLQTNRVQKEARKT